MKKKEKLLTVVIVSYNSGNYLLDCLDSLKKSRFPRKLMEIIIFDNASNDNTVYNVRRRYPQITLITNTINSGFASANNKALSYASGKYILFLNPDTLIPPDTLPEIVRFMETKKNAAVSTCRVELPDKNLDDASHRGFPTPWNALCHFLGLSRLFPGSLIFNGYHLGYRNLDKIHRIDSCAGAFMLVRKSAGDQIRWFDEDYFWYGEDLDFCFRIKKAGLNIYFFPRVKVIHYKGISSGIKKHSEKLSTAGYETKLRSTRARFDVMRIFYRKHYRSGVYRILTPLVLIGIAVKERLTVLGLKNYQYADRI
ncbi:hypothetical protein A3B48_00265 [Candidatus Gottesmanbacteria bacterium RIFCSPLOWO2_01_FULL_40_10]|nr:MAG: hypothetical protein A3B48_00265 [Candidatus Gottesmanbacteria bacterium RIFCSPLOWO2_01_FULL_40_10]